MTAQPCPKPVPVTVRAVGVQAATVEVAPADVDTAEMVGAAAVSVTLVLVDFVPLQVTETTMPDWAPKEGVVQVMIVSDTYMGPRHAVREPPLGVRPIEHEAPNPVPVTVMVVLAKLMVEGDTAVTVGAATATATAVLTVLTVLHVTDTTTPLCAVRVGVVQFMLVVEMSLVFVHVEALPPDGVRVTLQPVPKFVPVTVKVVPSSPIVLGVASVMVGADAVMNTEVPVDWTLLQVTETTMPVDADSAGVTHVIVVGETQTEGVQSTLDWPGGVSPMVHAVPKLVPVTVIVVPWRDVVRGVTPVTVGTVPLTNEPPVDTKLLHVTTTGYRLVASVDGVLHVMFVADMYVGDVQSPSPTLTVHPVGVKPVPEIAMGLPPSDTAIGAEDALIWLTVRAVAAETGVTAVRMKALDLARPHVMTTEADPAGIAVPGAMVQGIVTVPVKVPTMQVADPTVTVQVDTRFVPVIVKVWLEEDSVRRGRDETATAVIVGPLIVTDAEPAICTPDPRAPL